jgi:flagellin-like protein
MDKGISAVIATILLLLITISIIGIAFVFFTRIARTAQNATEQQLQQQTAQLGESYRIEGVNQNQVFIRNLGTVPISDLVFYVNNVLVNYTGPASLPPNQVDTYVLDYATLSAMPGTATLRVSSTAISKELVVDINLPSPFNFIIQGVDKNQVTIQNTGIAPITIFTFTVNGVNTNYAGSASLAPSTTGVYVLNDSVLAQQTDPATLNVSAGVISIAQNTCFYCNYYRANWKFDEVSGNIVLDSSPYGNNGTLVNGVARVSGQVGNAVKFDGLNDYVNVPDYPSLNLSNRSYSISMWFRLEGNNLVGNYRTMLNKPGAGDQKIYLLVLPAGTIMRYIAFQTGFIVNLNQFYHLTYTFTAMNDTLGTERMYVNGNLVNNRTGAVPGWLPGFWTIGGAGGADHLFNGTIDELRITNITRSMNLTPS